MDNGQILLKIKEKFPQIIIIGYGFKSELAIDFNDLVSKHLYDK
jgi:hypothetical protein